LESRDGKWASVRGTTSSGAILVRPDLHVAARISAIPADPERTLRESLQRLLCVSVAGIDD
jgi:2,4-dichlorophenol 6-monooxygenase